MANKFNQKLKILLILNDLLENSDEDNPIDAEHLILHLKNKGIESERKSIYRDISILQEYGYDIIKTRSPKSGYYIGNRDFQVAEIRLLCDAIQAANFITPKKTKELLDKIYKLVSKAQAQKIKNQVYVDNRPKCSNERIYIIIDLLDRAIQSGHQVKIVYRKRKIGDKNKVEYEEKTHYISPYALVWSDDHYYLICNNRTHTNIMITRVDRIKSAEIISDAAVSFSAVSEYRNYFDTADFVNKHFSMFAGEPARVELICDNSIIEQILDRFGERVSILKNGEDKFKITAEMSVSDGLVSWIMQFGKNIKVKSPPELKKMLLERVDEIKEQYVI
ncbi:MAG: WYL domain-containing protein [Ruminococcaceae bacterium]|nr:WYL domain-containing protein [Oscillospiraceae bacterium]